MIDIVNVGDQKTTYPDSATIQFESLEFYLKLARKTIAKFGQSMGNGISKEMLSSEDAVANVANAIMMADWRWDPDRYGATGQQKTKYSYRNQCAIWAVKSYVSRKYKKNKSKKQENLSIDSYLDSSSESSFKNLLPSKCLDPLSILIENESSSTVRDYVNDIINSDILTERQRLYLKYYFIEDMTLEDIGKKFSITREAVRQGIQKACAMLREMCND